MKWFLLTLMSLLFPSLSYAGICPFNDNKFHITSADEICFLGDVQFPDTKNLVISKLSTVAKNGHTALMVVYYPNTHDDDNFYHYQIILFTHSDHNEVIQKVIRTESSLMIKRQVQGDSCRISKAILTNDGQKTIVLCSNDNQYNEIKTIDNTNGKLSKIIIDGNSLELIQSGEMSGKIITLRRHYFSSQHFFDSYYLVSLDGKSVKRLTDDKQLVDAFLEKTNQ